MFELSRVYRGFFDIEASSFLNGIIKVWRASKTGSYTSIFHMKDSTKSPIQKQRVDLPHLDAIVLVYRYN